MLKKIIKKIIPRSILLFYHKVLAMAANVYYDFPSEKMVVIGVTGTKGKSTTVMMISRILEEAGFKVGSTNTMFFKIDEQEWVNNTKQGMPGRFRLQKFLDKMQKAECDYAVVEVTSEGILQHRHWGIAFDVVAFTNLSPEHIEAHGSFAAYREAKLAIFKDLHKTHRKKINNKEIKKVIVANRLDDEADSFLDHWAQEKWNVWGEHNGVDLDEKENHIYAQEIKETDSGVVVSVDDYYIKLNMHGGFMAQNALLAVAVAKSLGISLSVCEQALEKITLIPGRLQLVGNKKDIKVFVDYAHEPKSMQASLQVGASLAREGNLITVFGVTGGGRDKAKRPQMGKVASDYSDKIVLTTDDPYDDEPALLIQDIVPGIDSKKFRENENYWQITDRKKAIHKALKIAKKGDVVMILGKGSENKMAVSGGKLIDWSDVEIVRNFCGR